MEPLGGDLGIISSTSERGPQGPLREITSPSGQVGEWHSFIYSYLHILIEHLLWPGTVLGVGNMKVSKADKVPAFKDLLGTPGSCITRSLASGETGALS